MTYSQYTAICTPIETDQGLEPGTLWRYTKSIAVKDFTNIDMRSYYLRDRLYFVDNAGDEFTGFAILDDLEGYNVKAGSRKDMTLIPLERIMSISFEFPKPYERSNDIADLL